MITEFSIGYSRTINLGKFESARVEARVTTVVPDGSRDGREYQILKDYAQRELRKLLEETYKNQYTDHMKTA